MPCLSPARVIGVKLHTRKLTNGRNQVVVVQLTKPRSRLTRGVQADIILISIGVNDVTGLSSARHWRDQLEQMLCEIRTNWPQAGVIFAGLPPMGCFPLPPQPLRFTLGHRAAILDAIAAGVVAKQAGMLHIATDIKPFENEFCADGVHPQRIPALAELACLHKNLKLLT